MRLYDKLFTQENMGELPEGADYKGLFKPGQRAPPALRQAGSLPGGCKARRKVPVRAHGLLYPGLKNPGVWNRIVTLKDSFSKTLEQK